MLTLPILKAIRVVLPRGTHVGGISPDTMKPCLDVGATGFVLGLARYKPGRARRFVSAWQRLNTR